MDKLSDAVQRYLDLTELVKQEPDAEVRKELANEAACISLSLSPADRLALYACRAETLQDVQYILGTDLGEA